MRDTNGTADVNGTPEQARERVLVLATSGIRPAEVAAAIDDRVADDAEVRVVGTASGLSRLDWLTNAEDDARADAEERAESVASAIPQQDVDSTVGDVDPVQALADEVRVFHPDRIVVVTRDDDDVTWLETDTADSARRLLDVPVTHVVVAGTSA